MNYCDIIEKYSSIGTRDNPLCFAYHNEFGWVPIICFDFAGVLWDDNQWDRTYPDPNPVYNFDVEDKFNFDKPIFVSRTFEKNP